MRFRAALAVVSVLLMAAGTAAACQKDHFHDRIAEVRRLVWTKILTGEVELPRTGLEIERKRPARARLVAERDVDLSAYEGVAAWVDVFDPGPWDHPARMVRRLDDRHVEAIFVQTSTYGRTRPLMHSHELSTMLKVAHHRDMQVVAWYVPSFAKMDVDLRRSMDAVRFRSESGHRFDGFALDIESTVVGNLARRNERLLRLSDKIRARVGNEYPLGAITPDPQASAYWPNFPWKPVGKRYDAIVPMAYFSFFTNGYDEVRRYTERDIEHIREETDNPDIPIHVIGGIADDAKPREVRGFVHASKKREVLGASLYDSPITSPDSWRILRAFNRSGPVVAKRDRVDAAQGSTAEGDANKDKAGTGTKRSKASKDGKKRNSKRERDHRDRSNRNSGARARRRT
jgi:hypothetical protein